MAKCEKDCKGCSFVGGVSEVFTPCMSIRKFMNTTGLKWPKPTFEKRSAPLRAFVILYFSFLKASLGAERRPIPEDKSGDFGPSLCLPTLPLRSRIHPR